MIYSVMHISILAAVLRRVESSRVISGSSSNSVSTSSAADIFAITNLAEKSQQTGRAAVNASRLLQAVGSNEADALNVVCDIIEAQFEDKVNCVCSGNPFTSFNLNCEYISKVCGDDGTVCGRPVIGLSLADGGVFSAAACVTNYERNGVAYGDTCIQVDLCEETDGFCDCTVTFDDQVCDSCTVCDGGKALSLDCTNANAEAITSECQSVDFDLNLGGGGFIAGFLPTFQGLCSDLEDAIDGRIECDCSNSGGQTFDIICETKEPQCQGNVCGEVKSKVEVVNNAIETVTACVDFATPQDLNEICTKVEICEDDNSAICGCTAIYGGKACQSCEICDGRNSLKLDCSNIREDVIIDVCQAVTAASAYEFVPDFTPRSPAPVDLSNQSSDAVVRTAPALAGIVGVALASAFL